MRDRIVESIDDTAPTYGRAVCSRLNRSVGFAFAKKHESRTPHLLTAIQPEECIKLRNARFWKCRA